MKKLFAPILALALALSMGAAAFADTDDVPVSFTKTYKVEQGIAPAETFTFKFEAQHAEDGHGNSIAAADIPAIANVTADFDSLAAGDYKKDVNIAVNADDYKYTGVYTYKVTEIVDGTAGVTYFDKDLYLVVTILSDGSATGHKYVAAIHYEDENGAKTGDVVNTYEAGELSVTKVIEGNMADMDNTFEFTIVLHAPKDEVVKSNVTYSVAGGQAQAVTFVDGVATVKVQLGHKQTVSFANIPEGVTYEIAEDNEGYSGSEDHVNADGLINAGDQDSATFTNTLDKETVDTAVILENAPFVAVIAVVAAAAVVFVVSRRRSAQF